MRVLTKTIRSLTLASKWFAMLMLLFMMLFIAYTVIARALKHPVIGSDEVVQIAMVVLIMFGLAYVQSQNAHISIGLLADKFPQWVQAVVDAVGYLLAFLVCCTVSWVFIGEGLNNMFGSFMTTTLLEMPLFPLKFIVAIGFLLWGLEALLKVIVSIVSLIKSEYIPVDLKGEGH